MTGCSVGTCPTPRACTDPEVGAGDCLAGKGRAPARGKLVEAVLRIGKSRSGTEENHHWAGLGKRLVLRGSLSAVLRVLGELPGVYRLRGRAVEGHQLRVAVDYLVDRDGYDEEWTRCGSLYVTLGFPRELSEGISPILREGPRR